MRLLSLVVLLFAVNAWAQETRGPLRVAVPGLRGVKLTAVSMQVMTRVSMQVTTRVSMRAAARARTTSAGTVCRRG